MKRIFIFSVLILVASCIALAVAGWVMRQSLIERISVLEGRVAREKARLDDRERVVHRVERLENTVFVQQEHSIASLIERDRQIRVTIHAQEFPWTGGSDSPLQARLVSEFDVVRAGEPVRLMVEIRNNSNQQQTIRGVIFQPFLITVYHNGKKIQNLAPRALWQVSPVTLPPGRIFRSFVDLTTEIFPELGQTGQFTAEWAYSSSAGKDITWAGNVPLSVSWQAQ